MAALGPCNNLTSSTYIVINELTTVASVYALAPFMSGYQNVGAANTDAAGIANAFQTVNSLVNTATGSAPGPGLPTDGIAPTAEIFALADILRVASTRQVRHTVLEPVQRGNSLGRLCSNGYHRRRTRHCNSSRE